MDNNPTPENKNKKSGWQSFWELLRFAVIIVVIVIPIRIFIAQPFIVSGSSMIPTFEDGEYLIVDEISYRLGNPKRDDVVILRSPNNTKVFFIKRIIGLPGETLDLKGEQITVTNQEHPEGFVLDQAYLVNKSNSYMRVQLGKDEYFVLGDNRAASSDSRYWGAVPKKLLVGRALLRLLPVGKIDFMPGAYHQAE